MAEQTYYNFDNGISLNDRAYIIEGEGPPGSDTRTNEAPSPSLYLDSLNNEVYLKYQDGSNDQTDWTQIAAEKDVATAVAASVSWREPVKALENISTVLPAPPVPGVTVIDGYTVQEGDRILFSELLPTGNVYIVEGGQWVEDVNEETPGDTIYVEDGTTYAGKRFTFTKDDRWVQTDLTSDDELNFVRLFIGKTASGAELPEYYSTNIVTQGNDLEAAIAQLDEAIGGPGTGGLADGLGGLEDSLGDTTFVPDNGTTSPDNTVNENIGAVSQLQESQSYYAQQDGATGVTVMDSVESPHCKWLVHIIEAGTTNCIAQEVSAAHNESKLDYNLYSILKPNGNLNTIAGLQVKCTLIGTTIMNLEVIATGNPVDIKVRRIASI